MSEFSEFGKHLRELLVALLNSAEGDVRLFGDTELDLEVKARARRRDPSRVPGAEHFASTLAYGNFILANGTNIRCEAIPGISGVMTSAEVKQRDDALPEVSLKRILTHFHFETPSVLIEQNPLKESVGVLTGVEKGARASLLPGKSSFSQYLYLSLEGRVLANREPLVMTAERVDEWPPIGATYVSEAPTDFFDLDQLDNLKAERVATLAACKATMTGEVEVPRK